MLIIAVLVNVGMWFERFVIVVTSLSRDFLPSSWGTLHQPLLILEYLSEVLVYFLL